MGMIQSLEIGLSLILFMTPSISKQFTPYNDMCLFRVNAPTLNGFGIYLKSHVNVSNIKVQ